MDQYMAPATPHESFSLMLLERLEALEKSNQELHDELTFLRDNLDMYQTYSCFKFTKSFKCRYTYNIRDTVKETINLIMEKRVKFLPIFAMWKYDVRDSMDITDHYNEEERYYVDFTMYLRIDNPASSAEFASYIKADQDIKHSILPGDLYNLKLLVREEIAFQSFTPFLDENHKIEIWKKGALDIETDVQLDPVMNTYPFMGSSNYYESEELQLDHYRLVQREDWHELFIY